MKEILKTFQKKLTNLNASNKSLLALRTFDSDIDLHRFDAVLKEGSFAILEQLILQKSSIALCDFTDARSEHVNELSKKLKKVQRIQKLIFDEQGTNDLYVGWPFVSGMFANGQLVRCPLLFFPVALSVVGNKWVIVSKNDVEITINKSFLLAYSLHQNTSLDTSLYDAPFALEAEDSLTFRTQLYELLKASNLELNFNQELFQNNLQSFASHSRKDYEALCQKGALKLLPQAVLGQFPQAGNFLSHDYDYMLAQENLTNLEDFFVEKTTDFNAVTEDKICAPFALDAWQEDALKASKSGKSIVVQGPPGTGKSQLICNLVSDYIARGQKVLVVSQKRAALEVVYNRLQQLNLGNFIGVVHDYKNDRRKIYDQLSHQIESVSVYKNENSSLNAIILERQYVACNKRIQEITTQLSSYKKALFDTAIYGKSIKELYLTTEIKNSDAIDFIGQFIFFNEAQLEESCRNFHSFFTYHLLLSPYQKLTDGRIDYSNFQTIDAQKIVQLVAEIPVHFNDVTASLKLLLQVEIDYNLMEACLDKSTLIADLVLYLKSDENKSLLNHLFTYQQESAWLTMQFSIIESIHQNTSISIAKYMPNDLAAQRELIELGIEKAHNKIRWMGWKLFSSKYKKIQIILAENGLSPTLENLYTYRKIVQQRVEDLRIIEEISRQLWQFPIDVDLHVLNKYFNQYQEALQVKEHLKSVPFISEVLKNDLNKTEKILQEIVAAAKLWQPYQTQCLVYFSKIHFTKIINETGFALAFKNFVKEYFEMLVTHDILFAQFTTQEKSVLNLLRNYTPQHNLEALINIFIQCIQLHWIDYIETIFPILKIASNGQLSLLETELQSAIKEKLQLSEKMIQLHVREHTYQGLQYNRLNNLTTYRDLKHQVTKKKNLWTLRQLFQTHQEEIHQLIPCWLVSPASVSAIFPIEEKVDLVIFDEASQCYAEQGFPAMYRAKQLVIAGDSKQLAPYDLYQIRWESSEEENPDSDVASLLSLAERYLEPHVLQGHYRSLYPELIEFSNQYFYKSKLHFLPYKEAFQNKQAAIDFIKIEGQWEKGINTIEALSVAALAFGLFSKFPHKSIGIICFNFTQSQLVQDHIDALSSAQNATLTNLSFVKNIENVQGDECDIIILAVGYAPDKQGKLHAQFGSLNLAGGANRLNVAITRAKEKIIVVSSILPSQLEVQNTLHDGPKLLKKYLEYAYAIAHHNPISAPVHQPLFQDSWYLWQQLILDFQKQNILGTPHTFAELIVSQNNSNSKLVFTDDEGYYAAQNIKEYHAYKILEANRKNWETERFASRNYFLNRK